jgi:hypothetical protein
MAEKCIQKYKNIQEISNLAADVLGTATTAKHTTDTDNNTQKIKTTSVIRSLTTETTQDHHLCRSYENDDDTNNRNEADSNKTEDTNDDEQIQNLNIEQQKRKDLTILLKNNYVNNNKKSDQQSIFTTTIAVVSNEQEEDDNRESDVDDDVNDGDDDRHHCIDDDSDSDIISTNSSIEQPSGREIEQMQFDCEKVEIYLETPVVDENNIDADITGCPVVDILNSGKPKRLSDEFFSADDGDDEQEEETIEKSNTVHADNNIAMIISCENIVDVNNVKTTGVVAVKEKTNVMKPSQSLVDQSSSCKGVIIKVCVLIYKHTDK